MLCVFSTTISASCLVWNNLDSRTLVPAGVSLSLNFIVQKPEPVRITVASRICGTMSRKRTPKIDKF